MISLKNAVSRRQHISRHLQTLGIEFEFVDATRGDELDPALRKSLNPKANMSLGALGCYVSHIKIYERMVAENTPMALVLEDDTVLHSSVKDLLVNGTKYSDFDYCFLGCNDHGDEGYSYFDSQNPVQVSEQHRAYRLSSGPYCTHAYLIPLESAKRRLACAFPTSSPIDHYHPLPYRPKFMAIFDMVAFVSEESAVGSMSSNSWSSLQTNARQHWWYYPLRDILKATRIRKQLWLRKAMLPYPSRWKSFVSGFRVMPLDKLEH